MTTDVYVLPAIVGMAAATYATRAGGYLLFRAFATPPIVRAALAHLPGALFVSYVAPALVQGGAEQWCGAIATASLMVATRNLTIGIFGGTLVAWITWTLI